MSAHGVIFTYGRGKGKAISTRQDLLKGHGKKWRRYLADFDNRLRVRYICANSSFVGVLRNNLSNGNEEMDK